jgi:hypothetical protein
MLFLSFPSFQFSINAFLLVNALFHLLLLPFHPRYSLLCYRQALQAALVAYGVSLYRTNKGKLKLNLQVIRQLTLSTDAQYFFHTLLLFFVGYVNLFILAPLCIYASFNVASAMSKVIKPNFPSLYRKCDSGIVWLFAQTNQAQLYASLLEVMLGILLIVNTLTGQTSFFIAVVHWNFLSYRYQTAPSTQLVFGQLRVALDQVFNHRLCPALLRMWWEKMITFLRAMATRH